jgi:hypothetical protein
MMLAPGRTPATVEDAIAAEVAAIQDELHRIDSRLRALGWGASVPARRVAENWGEVALGIPDDGYRADGDRVARQALSGKRDALLHRLGELRQRLTGAGGGASGKVGMIAREPVQSPPPAPVRPRRGWAVRRPGTSSTGV